MVQCVELFFAVSCGVRQDGVVFYVCFKYMYIFLFIYIDDLIYQMESSDASRRVFGCMLCADDLLLLLSAHGRFVILCPIE